MLGLLRGRSSQAVAVASPGSSAALAVQGALVVQLVPAARRVPAREASERAVACAVSHRWLAPAGAGALPAALQVLLRGAEAVP